MEYRPVKEVADLWGLTVRRVQMMCMDGTIKGAKKEGKLWMVPEDTEKPLDKRVVTGAYKKANIKKKSQSKNNGTADKGIDRHYYVAMSHDIRTCLNSIMGYSDMILTDSSDADKVKEYASKINQSGKTMVKFLDNFMLLSRLENDDVHVKETVCSPTAIISRLLEAASSDAENNDLNILTKFLSVHEFVYSDEELLTILFETLLYNSINYSRHSGIIRFRAEEIPTSKKGFVKVLYTIEDNGRGVSENYINGINKFLHNKEVTYDIAWEITVIRMYIVKKLIEMMNGTIDIESHLDFGTRIMITLEHRIADYSAFNPEEEIVVDYESLKGKTILLADDNEINRKVAGKVLSDKGINVEFAEDGIICVAMLEKAPAKKYDCILMDLQMPNMNGYKASEIIRSLEDTEKANIPIIAVTASVFIDDKERALKVGMDGFVEKPFDKNILFAVIQKAIEKTHFYNQDS